MQTEDYTKKMKENNQIVIDIETYANMEVLDILPEPSIDSRLKDPEKVEAAQAEARAKQIDKMALSPLTGKIACIGFYNLDVKQVLFADSEKELLDTFWQFAEYKTLVTYNGKLFDVPFIFKRGIILGCEWATITNMKRFTDRYKSEKHIDLMAEFCNFGEYEKLDTLAKFILGEGKIDFDFKQIPELMKTPEGRLQIEEYCLRDCEITWKLAKRMGY